MFRYILLAVSMLVVIASAEPLFYSKKLGWDTETDSTFSIAATATDTSQPFDVAPDQSFQVYMLSGDGDSCKVSAYFIFASKDVYGLYSGTVCGVDSVGLDSTAANYATANPITSFSITCPARKAKCVVKGLATNSVTAASPQVGTIYITQYK